MRCAACGQLLADGTKRCPVCGAEINEQQAYSGDDSAGSGEYGGYSDNGGNSYNGNDSAYNDDYRYGNGYNNGYGNGDSYNNGNSYGNGYGNGQFRGYSAYDQAGSAKRMPMKWYKFLIYVSLLLTAISNIYVGIQTVMGLHYGDAETAEAIYEMFGAMRYVDKVYGILLVAFGLYAVIVRQKLARYRSDGPKHLLILYAAAFGLSLLYLIVAMIATGYNLMGADTVMSLLFSLLMVFLNKIYFDKRSHLFTN